MHKVTIKTITRVPVQYLLAECGVRYWEDATVNGETDHEGDLIPLRNGDTWSPLIDLETGQIEGWPKGTTANIHYKVADAGVYSLLDENRVTVIKKDGYVPSMLSPCGTGYGDYVIMSINENGRISDWSADLSYFEDRD